MKITLITVGKLKENFWKEAIAEYRKRLSRYCNLEIHEVSDEKTPDNAGQLIEDSIRTKEGSRILKLIKEDAYVIVLAVEGKKLSSEALADKVDQLGISGKSHIVFIIGGSIGVSNEVMKRADFALSFSDMTFPHQLIRVVLLEQIYRCFRINNGEPYHK